MSCIISDDVKKHAKEPFTAIAKTNPEGKFLEVPKPMSIWLMNSHMPKKSLIFVDLTMS